LGETDQEVGDAAKEVQHDENQSQKDEQSGAAALEAPELRDALVALYPGRDQSEMDIGHFVICDGRTRDHLLKALRRGIDADLREAPAQPSRLPAAKTLVSHP
jgi:hypothetical protein